MTDLKQSNLGAVDADWDDQLAFTRDLIRYPSLSGHAHTMQDFVFESLRKRGYTLDRWVID